MSPDTRAGPNPKIYCPTQTGLDAEMKAEESHGCMGRMGGGKGRLL